MSVKLLQGDCLQTLKTLEAGSVQTCVTSPPYYGLRDYGTAKWEGGDPDCDHLRPRLGGNGASSPISGGGSDRDEAVGLQQYKGICAKCGAVRIDDQIGLEETPEDYVEKLVRVFREVRRVLADDGVLWLNLGDSYFGSWGNYGGQNRGNGTQREIRGGSKIHQKAYDGLERFRPPTAGVRRVKTYGTSGKALADYQDHGCLCGNLCGVCRVAYQSHRFHNDGLLVAMLTASLSEPIHGYMELQSDHLPTSDYLHQENRNVPAILDQAQNLTRAGEPLRASLVSMLGESSPQLLEVCLQRANHGECLLCARSLVGCVQESADNGRGCSCGTASPFSSSVSHTEGNSHNVYPYLHSTTEYLKPKDLMGIPWMVAFALRADGWYLRSEIIWHKPNPMPESVTDRPTKSHEQIYLLSKKQSYYYNSEAIAEPLSRSSVQRLSQNVADQTGSTRANGGAKSNGNMKAVYKNLIPDGQQPHSMHLRRADGLPDEAYAARNKRDVWTVTTKPYKEAHFATFPPDLIEPCILAGSREGDTVLDPFNGSGTTGAVAIKHHRSYIGCELNPAYIRLTNKRLGMVQPVLFGVNP